MSNARNIASGSKFVDTAGDTMTGRLNISGASVNYATSPILQFNTTGTNTDNRNWAIGAADDHYGNFHIFRSQSQSDSDPVDAAGRSLTITKDGHVKKPNQPCFLAYGAASWTTISSGASEMTISNEVFDTSNNYNPSTYRFTAPAAGKYLIHGHAYVRLETSDDDSNHCYLNIRKNGSTYIQSQHIYGYFNLGDPDQIVNITVIMDMAVNDYASLYFYAASGSGSYYGGATQFMGYLIG